MAKYREVPCKYYIAFHQCARGREAEQKGYCQHCGKYEPRAHLRKINRKRMYNENREKKSSKRGFEI